MYDFAIIFIVIVAFVIVVIIITSLHANKRIRSSRCQLSLLFPGEQTRPPNWKATCQFYNKTRSNALEKRLANALCNETGRLSLQRNILKAYEFLITSRNTHYLNFYKYALVCARTVYVYSAHDPCSIYRGLWEKQRRHSRQSGQTWRYN